MDLSQLTAEQLDQLIADAVGARARFPMATELPSPDDAHANPAWRLGLFNGDTVMWLNHPGLGWMNFRFPAAERAHLLSTFLHHALAATIK